MRALLLSLCCLTQLAAAPLVTFDFEAADSGEVWRRKTNTTVDVRPPQPLAGQGALRFVIDPSEFSYGWVHTPLPAFTGVPAGVHGSFRAQPGASGVLTFHLCLAREGQELSYFRSDVGRLEESQGAWLEFYLPLAGLRYERGPITRLSPRDVGEGDLVQFLAGISGRQPVAVDLDDVELLTAEDAAPMAKRLLQLARERMLLPSPSGAPHPRLLLTTDRLEAYRAKAHAGGELQGGYDRLLSQAEDLVKRYNAADPTKQLSDFLAGTELESRAWSGAFEGQIVNLSYPLEILGAAYQLTGDRRFGEHGVKALVNAAEQLTVDESFWSRGFYYTRTFYVRALAFGYDWLGDLLPPADRKLVKITLLGFVKDIYDQSQTAGWGRLPLQRVWNWDPGLMSACGLGMLALEGETRLNERTILFECRRHLRDYLTLGIDEDGAGHEGPSYLGYGIGAGPEFCEVLRRQGRGDLFLETNYQNIPAWLVSETLPDGRRWNNLSDCGHGQRAWSVYLYAAARLSELAKTEPRRPDERWTSPTATQPLEFLQHFLEAPGPDRLSAAARAGLMARAWQVGPGREEAKNYDARTALAQVLLFGPLAEPLDPNEVLDPALWFRGRGLVVCRTGYDEDSLHLAIEAGPHAAGHDQCDKGTFTLYGYGGDLAIDSGYGNDGELLKSGSSYAHNVVLIDGEGQPMRYHNQSGGNVTGFCHTSLADWIRVDAKEAWSVRYDGDLAPSLSTPVERANRSFVFVRPADGVPPYLVIHDDIQMDAKPRDYTWQWHIPAQMKFELAADHWLADGRRSSFPVLTSTDETPGNAAASFTFEVPQAGDYVVWGLVRAGGVDQGKSDSFFAKMDDGPALTWDLATGAALAWDDIENRGESEGRKFTLAGGQHTLTLSLREREAELARLLILPADADRPQDPEATPAGAIALGIDDAVDGAGKFVRKPAGILTTPPASLAVYPVNPTDGQVGTAWFETSREGSHPRLQYKVKAVDPHFVMVLVPRTTGTPQPQVKQLGDGLGAVVEWPGVTDRVVFDGQSAGDVTADGAAALVRTRGGKVTDWALYDGTSLTADGTKLHQQAEAGCASSLE